MAPRTYLFVPADRPERYAKARRMPVSGLVMAALEAYLADADLER